MFMEMSLNWEGLVLVSRHIKDPKTLAIASCVCKSWRSIMSSDFIWKPICFSHFPSLFSLHHHDHLAISYHRLYTLAQASSLHRRRLSRSPIKPCISLEDLSFAVDVFDGESNRSILSFFVEGEHLKHHDCSSNKGVFRFGNMTVMNSNRSTSSNVGEEIRVRWNVVLKEWKGVFLVMDCKGKLGKGRERWFTEELPLPGWWSWIVNGSGEGGGSCGLVAELGLALSSSGEGDGKEDEEKKKVEKVMSMGLMSVVCWRYVSIEDGLRYLQHFLLPSG